MNQADRRLFELGGGFIAIRDGYVNLDDILSNHPGRIVRCRLDPRECISVFYGDPPIGVAAGWISDEEVSNG